MRVVDEVFHDHLYNPIRLGTLCDMRSEFPYDERSDPIANSPRGKPIEGGGYPWDKSVNSSEGSMQIFSEYVEKNKIFSEFVRGLSGEETWLDLGSGMQTALVKFLLSRNKINQDKLLSVDLDIDNLHYQQNEGLLGHKINADAFRLPLADESIDVLVMNWMMPDNFINEGRKRPDIIKEISRVVRGGGILITSAEERVMHPDDFQYLSRAEIETPRGYILFSKKDGISKKETPPLSTKE